MRPLSPILAFAFAAALAGCALKAPPDRGRTGEGGTEQAGAGAVGCARRPARGRRRSLARELQRPAPRRIGPRGARIQLRPPGRGRARRAGRRVPEGCRRDALPAGQRIGPRRRQLEWRLQRIAGHGPVRELGIGYLGPRSRRLCRGAIPIRFHRAVSGIRAAVDCCAGRKRLVPRDGGTLAKGPRR